MNVQKYSTATAAVRDAIEQKRLALLAMIRRHGAGKVDPEDVLQRAAQRALERADQLREPARAQAWVARVARNVLFDEMRSRSDVPSSVDVQRLAAADKDGFECWCVLAQLRLLKPAHAQILQRVVLESVPVAQVAKELGLTPNNAMVRLHRARAALRQQVKKHCGMTTAQSCADCGCAERGCCPSP